MEKYLNIKNLRKGDIFYECERGFNIKMTALENSRRIKEPWKDGWTCKVLLDGGNTIEIFECINPGAYGLKLYWEKQYFERETLKDE